MIWASTKPKVSDGILFVAEGMANKYHPNYSTFKPWQMALQTS
jgi:hypothetical protein